MSSQFVASFAVVMLILVNFCVIALYVRLLKRRSRLARVALEENPSNHHNIRRLEMEIKAMPVFLYSKAVPMRVTDGGDATECVVCLGDFKENDSCRLLPLCKHWFHTQCIDMWFTSHSNCPLCRASILHDSTNPICNGGAFIDGNSVNHEEAHLRIEISPPIPVDPSLPILVEAPPPPPPPEQEVHIASPPSSSHNNSGVDNSTPSQNCNSFKLLLVAYRKIHN